MKAYHIRDWDTDRENWETRKYAELLWFRSKVKLLGEGFGHTLNQPDGRGPHLYGMFKIIEQIAASGRRQERGWLIRNGTALDAQRMANLMRLPQTFFEEALAFFSTPPMNWLEAGDWTAPSPADSRPDASGPESSRRLSGKSPADSRPDASGPEVIRRNSASNERTYEHTNELRDNNKGRCASLEEKKDQRAQFAALAARRQELEAEAEGDRSPEVKVELREVKGRMRSLQKKQAAGDFTPL